MDNPSEPVEEPVDPDKAPPPAAPPADPPPVYQQPSIVSEPWVSQPPPSEAPVPPKPVAPLGLGAGIGLGFAALAIGLILMFATIQLTPSIWGALWPFLLVPAIGAGLMFSARWRRFGTGVLIAAASTWLIIIGPCIGLLTGFGQYV